MFAMPGQRAGVLRPKDTPPSRKSLLCQNQGLLDACPTAASRWLDVSHGAHRIGSSSGHC